MKVFHSRSLWKSSTIRKPPRSKYLRRRAACSVDSSQSPTPTAYRNGQLNISSVSISTISSTLRTFSRVSRRIPRVGRVVDRILHFVLVARPAILPEHLLPDHKRGGCQQNRHNSPPRHGFIIAPSTNCRLTKTTYRANLFEVRFEWDENKNV